MSPSTWRQLNFDGSSSDAKGGGGEEEGTVDSVESEVEWAPPATELAAVGPVVAALGPVVKEGGSETSSSKIGSDVTNGLAKDGGSRKVSSETDGALGFWIRLQRPQEHEPSPSAS